VSITFEFSFNAPVDFPLLVDAVNRALGTTLQRDGDVASGLLLGVAAVLEQHDLVDDRDLKFSEYRYQLRNKTWDGSALRAIQLETLILAAFALHNALRLTNGMLTYECQRLLAHYNVVDGRLSDSLSGAVIDVLDYIIEVQNRLDDSSMQ
jgi:hypothetical protein